MAQNTTTTAVLTHSVLATARIFVVLLAGFLASKWPKHEPLLTREVCRSISRVCALLFQPALVISSTGGTLNLADLQDSWQLVVAGGLTIGLSVVVATVSARLLLGAGAEESRRRAFQPVKLAIAFQNCAFIPLLLMQSLCEQDAIKSDFGDDADECFSQATSMIFLYYASWQVCFYAWGFNALEQDNTLELKLTGRLVRAPLVAEGEENSVALGTADAGLGGNIVRPRVYGPLATTASCRCNSQQQQQQQQRTTSGEENTAAASNAVTQQQPSTTIGKAVDEALDAPNHLQRTPATGGANEASDSAKQQQPTTSTGEAALEALMHHQRTATTGGAYEESDAAKQQQRATTTSEAAVDEALDAPKHHQRTAASEENMALETVKQQQTSTSEENMALEAVKQQRTATSEENVALEAGKEGLRGGGDGGGGGGDWAWVRVWQLRIWAVLVSPNIIAVMVGIAIAMISPLQDVLFSDPQAVLRPLGAALETLGTPTVAASLLVMAGSLVQVPKVDAGAAGERVGGDEEGPVWNWRRFHFVAGGLLVACRLVMVPAIGFAMFWVMTEHSEIMGENRLMRMIVLIELAMPSGAFIIVSLSQLKMPATAGFMARLYLWQHAASILTITLWTALAVHMVY